MKKEVIKIRKEDYVKAANFVQARQESADLYKRRGSFKDSDIYIGALGELAVARLLRKNGMQVKPDFEIYEKRGKSYDADLVYKGFHLHVKSQSIESATKYGKSYIMQRTDPLIKKDSQDHYMVPTLVDLDTETVTVLGIIPFDKIKEYDMISECRLEWFRKTKVAIYWENLAELSHYNRWGFLR